MKKDKVVDFIIQFMEDVNSEIRHAIISFSSLVFNQPIAAAI